MQAANLLSIVSQVSDHEREESRNGAVFGGKCQTFMELSDNNEKEIVDR
ncbi:hypothetical protein ABNC51_08850 [Paenibacillus larvae]